jgi:hypothetical protein
VLKISFWLKKSDTDQGNSEYITIDSPKVDKTRKFDWGNRYVCEVCLPSTKLKNHPVYGINPIDTLCLASETVKIYLQGLIKRGYIISEVENKEPWKLEKLSDNFLQEKINKTKSNKNISEENKKKILEAVNKVFK